ncbi:hypothetical protein [Hyphomonas pacifica]|uniref:Uncharacterized protein n=2 Tax=Hyphomonas pacifica TaxID=1280941 RepID=A0A062TPI0_9PROT|nr:hypothetical protein [Hyphomonas pacifica]KCZ48095.1 hypothetical protein HY2_16140 [Hyphomonas pacifica]RAN31591.1 hypothetical protein HY3_16450 [Hyphomonas pacifica]
MGLIWWILPAIAAVIGLMLLFAGFGKLAKLKAGSGFFRLVFGVGFLGLAGVVAFAGLNLQTYKRLTKERYAANIKFAALPGEDNAYALDMTLSDGTKLVQADGTQPVLRGNQFEVGAQVIKFKPMANMLGYDSIYRLDYIEGRMSRRFTTTEVTEATTNGIALAENPGLDVYTLAEKQGGRFGIDADYGSATYQPMGDKFEYVVNISQDALIARPTEGTKTLIQRQKYPGYSSVSTPVDTPDTDVPPGDLEGGQ